MVNNAVKPKRFASLCNTRSLVKIAEINDAYRRTMISKMNIIFVLKRKIK